MSKRPSPDKSSVRATHESPLQQPLTAFHTKYFRIAIAILLLGIGLRIHALVQDIRLEPDEAWFSTFAREAAINGGWWLDGPLDKTPLAIYANALAQVFVGDSEFAARLPGFFSSILLMPVMVAAARAWYRKYLPHRTPFPSNGAGEKNAAQQGGVCIFLLTALSPYLLTFSETAYTDGLMLMCLALALSLAGYKRWGWSGVWLGLGFVCKQQALFYLPLLLALAWLVGDLTKRRALRFLIGLSIPLLMLLVWDSVRPGESLFALAAFNNDPGRLIRSDEVLPRLTVWLTYGQALLGPGWLTAVMLVNGVAATLIRIVRQPHQRATIIDIVLLAYVLAYGLLHWLVAFNTYDRYLLPLLPPVILLAARGIDYMFTSVRARHVVPLRYVLISVLTLALLSPAIEASERRGAVGTLYRDYTGIDQLADYLNAQPVATVIYDRWLGWELRYYLGQWHDKRIVYYPTPELLARDALALCEIGPRYFPAPASKQVGRWLEALREVGFGITQTYDSPQFVVYQFMPPQRECS